MAIADSIIDNALSPQQREAQAEADRVIFIGSVKSLDVAAVIEHAVDDEFGIEVVSLQVTPKEVFLHVPADTHEDIRRDIIAYVDLIREESGTAFKDAATRGSAATC